VAVSDIDFYHELSRDIHREAARRCCMILGNEHYRAIGRIAVMFSDVEAWLSVFVWQLIGPEQHVGQMVTAGMSFKKQIDLLCSLFRHRFRDPALNEELHVITGRLIHLEDLRNGVVHSAWLRVSENIEEATRLKITANRRRGLTHTEEITTPAALDKLADDLHAALVALVRFFGELDAKTHST
jgi:hypothetical protein